MHINLINGLLGSGKTTLVLNLLKNATKNEKVAVLVNEFGEIGIDGDLLTKKGADVVELPNGCICCTLNSDLRSQIAQIAENYHPDRLFIEPTGIATIKNLLQVIRSLSLEKYISKLTVTVVLDASNIEETLTQNRGFVETQIEMTETVILNKCDLVSKQQRDKIQQIIRNINPWAQIQLTTFGEVFEQNFKGDFKEKNLLNNFSEMQQKHIPELPLKNYQQVSQESQGCYDIIKLRSLFQMVKDNQFGEVDRAKGIFKVNDFKWVRLDLASHTINEVIMDETFASSKIIIIGTQLNKQALVKELENCLLKG